MLRGDPPFAVEVGIEDCPLGELGNRISALEANADGEVEIAVRGVGRAGGGD